MQTAADMVTFQKIHGLPRGNMNFSSTNKVINVVFYFTCDGEGYGLSVVTEADAIRNGKGREYYLAHPGVTKWQ